MTMKAQLHMAMLHQSMPRNPPKPIPPKEVKSEESESEKDDDSSTKEVKTKGETGLVLSSEEGLTDYDVLFGRGTPFQNFPGNIRLRNVVAAHTDRYSKAKKEEKPGIAAEIVQVIKNEGNGRFLKRDKDQKSWIEVSDTDARVKVGHVLRRNIRDTNRMKAMSREAMANHELPTPPRVFSMEPNNPFAFETPGVHRMPQHVDPALARMLAASSSNRLIPPGVNPMLSASLPTGRHARLRRSMLLERELLLEREAMIEREMMLERRERLMRIQQLERELAVERELQIQQSLSRYQNNASK